MNLKKLVVDDEAVSPVIGVILMVAITVILAAVIGTFVLGLGDQVQSTSPNVQLSTNQATETITDAGGNDAEQKTVEVIHQGGDKLQEDNIDVTVNGVTAWDVSTGSYASIWNSGGEIVAGSSARIVAYNSSSVDTTDYYHASADNLASGDTIRVTWTSDSGDKSATLVEYDVN